MLIGLAKSGEIPPALSNRPKLTEWQQSFMDAFNCLNSSRAYTSVGPASIPYPYILSYLNEHRITDLSDREEFVMIVQAIDNAYLEHINKPKPK